MLWELSTLCCLDLISNIYSMRNSIINEVCDEQADEVENTTNLYGEYKLRGYNQQNELDTTRHIYVEMSLAACFIIMRLISRIGAPIPTTTFLRGIIFCFLTFSRMEIFTASFNFHTFLAIHAVFLVFLFSFSLQHGASAAFLGNETDKLALLGFKSQITENPTRVFASWNDSVHFCQWTGEKCGLRHGRVIRLNPKGRGWQEINLSHCVKLNGLVLEHNTLLGKISNQVGSLTKLVKLYIRNNNLTGLFPGSIGNLTSLEELYLSYKNLEGQVPASLARLTKLRLPGLSVNSLSGEFPPPLYNLSSLELISLSFNNFCGNLRSDLGNYFPNLQILGEISLQMLHFGDNQFVGTLPHSTVNLSSQLQRLLYYGNRITGRIPRDISNLVNLHLLEMSNNNLTGSTPSSIGRLTNLEGLNLGNSLLTGVIPSSIGNLIELVYLYLGLNRCIILELRAFWWDSRAAFTTLCLSKDTEEAYLTAHLGDFGLVRLILDEDLTAQFSSLGVKGTIGYAAPEYGMVNNVSALGDMYSFGILILEIFTGRRPTDTLFQASSSPHHFVETVLPEKVLEILDKTTFHGEMSKATNVKEYWGSIKKEEMECLVSILEIGVACSAESPRDRLTVTQVYSKLTLMREQFLQRGG
uniref:Leucine rich repeat containing protein, putative n=1 Tax=Solanum demissum TaxID=50514 RepID=Q0KIK0_SOLDE|nr:Leucine rich repeat containing protein, putative [Solanum demissum]